MKLDKVGEDFIKNQEKFRLHAYKDQVGIWTIGWGFTINQDSRKAIKEGDVITEEVAERWWKNLIIQYENTVNLVIRVPINVSAVSQNAFNACVSLCFNIGQEAFKNSTLAKYINNTIHVTTINIKDEFTYKQVQQFVKSGIAYWFLVFHMAGGQPNDDLIVRRKMEIKLYFS